MSNDSSDKLEEKNLVKERPECKYKVSEIFRLMDEKLPTKEDKILIKKAFCFSKIAHEGQKRASGDSYFSHAFETAKNLSKFLIPFFILVALDTVFVFYNFFQDCRVNPLCVPMLNNIAHSS